MNARFTSLDGIVPAPPPPPVAVAAKLETLVLLGGDSAEAPAVGVSLIGLTFAHSRPTYLDDYEAVSGGDWSFHRGGASPGR